VARGNIRQTLRRRRNSEKTDLKRKGEDLLSSDEEEVKESDILSMGRDEKPGAK